MKKSLMIVAAAFAIAGCRSITVEYRGEGIVEGKKVDRGWEMSYFTHWMATELDSLDVQKKADGISLKMGRVSTDASARLPETIEKSLAGAATLATKIGAAIATAGGTACADSVAGLIGKFVDAGGDPEKATVSCADGGCTITDGCVTCEAGKCWE